MSNHNNLSIFHWIFFILLTNAAKLSLFFGFVYYKWYHKPSRTAANMAAQQEQLFSSCSVFLAPSTIANGGSGVFANRPFSKDEIVEIAPMVMAIQDDDAETRKIIDNTILIDYAYQVHRTNDNNRNDGAVLLGNVMYYNSARDNNVAWKAFGVEPTGNKNVDAAQAVGLVALRDIEQGEELFSTYGGDSWFSNRGLRQETGSSERKRKILSGDAAIAAKKFCSKMSAGIGKDNWQKKVMNKYTNEFYDDYYWYNTTYLVTKEDRPYAIANQDIYKGDIIEQSPALLLSKRKIGSSMLAAVTFAYEDLTEKLQSKIKLLRDREAFYSKYNNAGGTNTNTTTSDDEYNVIAVLERQRNPQTKRYDLTDAFDSYEDIMILPGGLIGMVRRTANGEQNCRLEILSSGKGHGNAGVVLQLTANQYIGKGQEILLDIPHRYAMRKKTETGTNVLDLLRTNLMEFGHTVPEHLLLQSSSKNFDIPDL